MVKVYIYHYRKDSDDMFDEHAYPSATSYMTDEYKSLHVFEVGKSLASYSEGSWSHVVTATDETK
jgi:hypothetical protein